MGEGQIGRATKAIADGMLHGNWVVIENCHVNDDWLNDLEIICLDLSICDSVNDDFRLWLTSCPSEEFPMIVLQTSSKINMEQPAGVAENVSLLLSAQPWLNSDWCSNEFDGERQAMWQRCVFSLVLFHTIAKERTAASPIGWNIPYEFYEMDLVMSLRQLNTALASAESLPLDGHSLLIGECNYSSRVTDARDRILLRVLLDEIFHSRAVNEDGFVYSEFGDFSLPSAPTKVNNLENFAKLHDITNLTIIGLTEISVFDQNCNESFEVGHRK